MGRGRKVGRKRKYRAGNQYSKQSNSFTRLVFLCQKDKCGYINTDISEPESYFMLFDFSLLKDLVALIGCCPYCPSNDVKLENIEEMRMGFC